MVYLMDKGIEPQVSFDIRNMLERVEVFLLLQTGNRRRQEGRRCMREHNVPEWYIWSCKKIKYMFPKAHAAAYIMMALRVAWYKGITHWHIMQHILEFEQKLLTMKQCVREKKNLNTLWQI